MSSGLGGNCDDAGLAVLPPSAALVEASRPVFSSSTQSGGSREPRGRDDLERTARGARPRRPCPTTPGRRRGPRASVGHAGRADRLFAAPAISVRVSGSATAATQRSCTASRGYGYSSGGKTCAKRGNRGSLLHRGQDRRFFGSSFPDLGHGPDRRLLVVRIGVLGTGVVGRTIAGKLRELGHEVLIGSRTAGDDAVPFADAAAHGELVFNCTNGVAALDALNAAGAENLAGKVLVDVTNALDFSQGGPPLVGVSIDDSLGERIQRAFPEARVVKALNTMNANVMVDPGLVPGEHDVLVSGNDDEAKAQVVELLESFGWPAERILDLGDITGARGQELYVALWVRLMGVADGPAFNIHVVAG